MKTLAALFDCAEGSDECAGGDHPHRVNLTRIVPRTGRKTRP